MPAFYLSSLLAFTGGHMVNYAVILYLQEKVGSDLLSGIGFGLSFGTSILFGWFAGVLCDRISPTRVIHAAQALFILCLAGLWWTDAGASDATRVGWTLFSAFLGGLAWSFVGPARLATLGQIAPPDKLKPATIIFNLQVLLGFGLAPVCHRDGAQPLWLARRVCHGHGLFRGCFADAVGHANARQRPPQPGRVHGAG
jgi:MFS family permease